MVTYQFLGRSGLKVSNISLGCMTFGESAWGVPGQSDEDLSHQILDRYAQWGGNFLDTADIYGNGKSEEILGRWLERQPRDKFVIATKCGNNMGLAQNANNVGLSRRQITASVDASLKRLHTDFVDLFQTHIWDDATPVEETLRTLDDLVRIGKIRYAGASNVTGWQLNNIISTSKRLGLNPIISLQQQYSLASRWSELEAFQVCKSEGVGVLPWSPLKGGILSGKIARGAPPTGRTAYFAERVPFLCDLSDRMFDIVEAAGDIAKKTGRSTAQVAIRWLLQKDVVSSVIIGARTLAQLDDNMGAANGWGLTKEQMKTLDDASNPTLAYPYDMIFLANRDRKNSSTGDNYVRSTS